MLTNQEAEIINHIYGHFLGTGKWQGVKTINLRFGKSNLENVYERKPALLLKEESSADRRLIYKLTLEGVCECSIAKPILVHLKKYLKLLIEKFHEDPEIQSISGSEIERALGLTQPLSLVLQDLIHAGHFFGSAGFGGNWVIGFPSDIEDLAELGPDAYLEKQRKKFRFEGRNEESAMPEIGEKEDAYNILKEDFKGNGQQETEQKLKCFVILPIGKEGTIEYQNNMAVYQKIIEPCASNSGFNLDCYHADLINKSGDISSQVIEALKNDPIVIADLRRNNANVIYELGIRHAIGKRSIIVCSEHSDSFFHTTKYRAIRYKLDGTSNQDFFNRLKDQIQDIILDPDKNDNPVTDILDLHFNGGSRNDQHVNHLLYLSRKFKGGYSLGELFNTSTNDILDLKISYLGNHEDRKARVINSFDDPIFARPFNATVIKQKEIFYIVDFPRELVKVRVSGILASTREPYAQLFELSEDRGS